MNILDRIVARRRTRMEQDGYTMGEELPASRQVPLVPLPDNPFLICEVKRKSPSAGNISTLPDPDYQAALYLKYDVGAISVLTERDFFGGSLSDLIKLKSQNPGTFFLRKDFLLDPEDIEVSWRAGADGVLLIASVLDTRTLTGLHELAVAYGMEVLVEVHDEEEIRRVQPLRPKTVGINARNLKDFSVDLLRPVGLSGLIDWNPRLIFESGIRSPEDAALAFAAGFDGALIGETVMRHPELLPRLQESRLYSKKDTFWGPLYRRRLRLNESSRGENKGRSARDADHGSAGVSPETSRYRPLVKICGLGNEMDARLADDLGADILGFVLADSPRRIDPRRIREIGVTRARKAGVVVLHPGETDLPPEVSDLLRDGILDAVQFHGEEKPAECFGMAFPYYKALRIRDEESIGRMSTYGSPRVLADAFSPGMYGGTGTSISEEFISRLSERGPLWLAGGIGPENAGRIIRDFRPELIDASSKLESAPGKKDEMKMKKYFSEIEMAVEAIANGSVIK